METIQEKLFDYGLIGIMLFIFGIVIYHLFKKSEKNSKDWKDMGMEAMKNFHQLSKENAANSRELIEIQKQMGKRIDNIPQETVKEIRLQIPQANLTSART